MEYDYNISTCTTILLMIRYRYLVHNTKLQTAKVKSAALLVMTS